LRQSPLADAAIDGCGRLAQTDSLGADIQLWFRPEAQAVSVKVAWQLHEIPAAGERPAGSLMHRSANKTSWFEPDWHKILKADAYIKRREPDRCKLGTLDPRFAWMSQYIEWWNEAQ
jgi:hypothetical protein